MSFLSLLVTALVKISNDVDTAKIEEDVKLEMMRLKKAQDRLSEIEARSRMQRIDREAARRFVQHGLGKPNKRSECLNIHTYVIFALMVKIIYFLLIL